MPGDINGAQWAGTRNADHSEDVRTVGHSAVKARLAPTERHGAALTKGICFLLSKFSSSFVAQVGNFMVEEKEYPTEGEEREFVMSSVPHSDCVTWSKSLENSGSQFLSFG